MIANPIFSKGDTLLDKAVFPFFKNGITQVAWVVEDAEKTVENFYRLTNIGNWHFYTYGPKILSLMRRNGVDTEFEWVAAVANAGPLRLEVIQKPNFGDTVYNEFIEKGCGGGIQHFGIAVENMEESLEIVRKAGIKVTMEGAGYGLDGDGYFAYLDTEKLFGITLELMCRPKRRRDPVKILFPE